MTVLNSTRLDAGDLFPALTFNLTGGRQLRVPDDFDHPFQAILFFRGHWCPYCQTQLKSYQMALAKLDEEGIGVMAASVDDEEQSAAMIQSLGLTFPVAYGLPVIETARATGAFFDAQPTPRAPYLQSTGFVLGPDRRILLALYSSGAIGRLIWQDAVGMVRYAQKKAAA